MVKGTILYHRNFKFHDNKTGKKLLIVLNTPSNTQPHLLCKTTSKMQHFIQEQGCYFKRNIYFLKNDADWFLENTWIQLYPIYEIDSAKLLSDSFKKELEIKAQLKESTINAIRNCLRKSEDISQHRLALLG